MKYVPILSLVIAVTALIHSVSCTVQEVPAYGVYPPPQGQYGRPQGQPMMAQPYPGAPDPRMHPDQGQPAERPYGRFSATQTGRNHYNGRLQDGGQVVWTLNGAPVCASKVPPQAKQGFENGLRGRGYQGPIHHMTISNRSSGSTGQGSAPFQSPPVDAIPLDDNLETGSDAPAPLPDPVPSNPSFDRTLVRI